MKKVLNIIYALILVAVAFVAISFVSQDKINTFDYKIYSVTSGSMEPNIPVGSLIFINSRNEYVENDVITFRNKNSKDTTTHRIVKIEKDDDIGKFFYVTKGDANEDPDIDQVDPSQVLGKVIFDVPYLGYPVGMAKTQSGFVALIIIPATLIIYSELNSIKNEVKKMGKRKKKELLPEIEDKT